MRILLTGSSGFIGRNLKEYLSEKHTILAPTHQQLNLLDESAVELYFLTNTPNTIIHCAGLDKEGCLLSNLSMFLHLKKYHELYCTGKMLYFGSGAEYGREHWNENMREDNIGKFIPTDEYGIGKYIMTKLEGHNIYNLRLFGIFGQGENSKRRFISNCCNKLSKIEKIVINKNLNFDYMYIKDLFPIVDWFLENEPLFHNYNVCTGNLISFVDIVYKLMDISHRATMVSNENENFPYSSYGGNNERLKSEISNLKFTPIEESLKEMYDYYGKVSI